MQTTKRGFTLIELLLVIGIIAILASIVIVAINPTKQLGQARNAQRRADVNTILNAVYQYSIDNNGSLPTVTPTIPTGTSTANAKMICASDVTDANCSANSPIGGGGVNLRQLSGAYIVSLPRDPSVTGTATGTAYMIYQDTTTKRITVFAPKAEQNTTISVSR